MILGVLETILGIMIFNTSIRSLKRSAIRKWREGYYITFFLSILILVFGMLSIFVPIPDSINNGFLFIVSSFMFLSLFRISKMKGLQA